MTLQEQVDQLQTIINRMGRDVYNHERQLEPARRAPLVNRQEAERLYGPQAMRTHLAAGGSAPLNLGGLKGVVGEIQPAAIPELPQLPQLGDPTIRVGATVKVGQVTYRRGTNEWEPLVPSPLVVMGSGGQSGAATTQPAPGTGVQVAMLEGTHANRLASFPASKYPIATQFFESDRQLLYSVEIVAGVSAWLFLVGTGQDLHGARWADLGADDAGVEFIEPDRHYRFRWDGATWRYLSGMSFGLHADRWADLSAGDAGALFVETDRNNGLFYWDGAAWVLIEVTGYGTHADRWADLTAFDEGAEYIESDTDGQGFRWSGVAWAAVDIGGLPALATVGAIPFLTAAGILGQDVANLFWDSANHRLGIGSAAPAHTLDVTGDINASGGYNVNGVPGVGGTDPVGNVFDGGILQTLGATSPTGVTIQISYNLGGRIVGTVYQNTDTKPRFVSVSVNISGGGASAQVFCDAANPPTTQIVTATIASGNWVLPLSGFWVLPNYYYKVVQSAGTVTMQDWTEWH